LSAPRSVADFAPTPTRHSREEILATPPLLNDLKRSRGVATWIEWEPDATGPHNHRRLRPWLWCNGRRALRWQ